MWTDFKPFWLRNLLVGIIIVSFLLIITASLFYICHFSGQQLSNDPATWGQFGDFFGGTLNPLLALINICIFILLTLLIQHISNINNRNNIEAQKQIAIISLKNDEFRHFKENMDRVFQEWTLETNSRDKIDACLRTAHNYRTRLTYLYPNISTETNINGLIATINRANVHRVNNQDFETINDCFQALHQKEELIQTMGRMTLD